MSAIKDRFPDLPTLQENLTVVLTSGLTDFLQVTDDQRNRVIVQRRLFAVSFVAFILLLGLFFLPKIVSLPWLYLFLVVLSAVGALLLLSARSWYLNTKLLARELNMALVPILVDTFACMFLYTHNKEHEVETKELLKTSQLMTVHGAKIESDDMYTAYVDETEISFRELYVSKKVGNKQKIELFKGVFMVAKLPFSHEAETYISTEGDRTGFAHLDFWPRIVGKEKVVETELEWNDFEHALHVASSNPTVCRELLTPDFMSDLYDWWQEHKLNMRIAITGNTFYLLLPDASIHIGVSTTSSKLPDLERYAWSLARPIWRGLALYEDITT